MTDVSKELLPRSRESLLQAIGDVLEYWLRWVQRERHDEGLATTPDTHIMLSYENAPPSWPTVGQLELWLQTIRAQPAPADVVERVARAIANAADVDPDVFIGMHGRDLWEEQWHPQAIAALSAMGVSDEVVRLREGLREALDMVVDAARDGGYSVSEFNELKAPRP